MFAIFLIITAKAVVTMRSCSDEGNSVAIQEYDQCTPWGLLGEGDAQLEAILLINSTTAQVYHTANCSGPPVGILEYSCDCGNTSLVAMSCGKDSDNPFPFPIALFVVLCCVAVGILGFVTHALWRCKKRREGNEIFLTDTLLVDKSAGRLTKVF
eukprot:TRINITY_DN2593_c1_g1_i1.p1 TRINITY_DN2593_c1_g1~~TRINITY_DN2593_c1_g1_i1.p1  ORF type:complete len:155 (+),score=17.38 TRINITY_DN2593_c1_g1_i1:101-565(+)